MTDKETKPKKTPKRAEKAAAATKYVKVTLVRSLIGYPRVQWETAKGLGLRKLNSHAVLKETPETLGMVHKIIHVLKVETVEKP
ncbi:MAG: 50S ribosomal protein L30 [Acidobacteria bacterium]|nr:50S ribosomal protein L30 [Acidobacteriota bacterium]MBE3129365.1 50S ribosomal protein L30 [Acidobacteriota bacterium]